MSLTLQNFNLVIKHIREKIMFVLMHFPDCRLRAADYLTLLMYITLYCRLHYIVDVVFLNLYYV